jgi:hypothetical protein
MTVFATGGWEGTEECTRHASPRAPLAAACVHVARRSESEARATTDAREPATSRTARTPNIAWPRTRYGTDDPSKVPPPQPRKSLGESLYAFASRNWILLSVVGGLMTVGLTVNCYFIVRDSRSMKAKDIPPPRPEEFAAGQAASPPRTFGNVPLSEQQAQRESPSRTFGNVPLSQQKPHAE